MRLAVRRSNYAGAQLAALQTAGEAKPNKAQGARWKALRRILDDYLPDHGLNPKHLKSNDLSGIRAIHCGARDRVVWIASQEKRTVIVLMVGFVKEGDRGDTYPELLRLLGRGDFDECFAELDLPKPGEATPPPRPPIPAGDGDAEHVPPDTPPTVTIEPPASPLVVDAITASTRATG